ncbi:ClpXP protease specificity-enhancing factor [Massilia sp. TS11]|uniref:ClpXP protease specificity-enhancing factor n=1 Tax=Massilia sp. TS11 TaxID=2908003 RepID=UPI001EDADA38|nr:ClpXP protease specificity-enhancing factor [Massilia sp. TS11]MCG2585837.1 ClpXP protease specificity-enhancing factor [Massilia sp. TS11]
MADTSTKPYLLRALYEWCTDNGYTPHIAVKVDGSTQVPPEYVRKGEIVLNISFGATHGLKMDNEAISFKARFAGVAREIYVPVTHIMAIYAAENGQGMAFDVTAPAADATPAPAPEAAPLAAVPAEPSDTPEPPDGDDEPPKKGPRPTLTRIK